MAFLKDNDVIFYHPLDDYEEFTANQVWDGSGTFIPGQIGSGNSAVAIKALNFGNIFLWTDEGDQLHFPTKHGMANIDNNHIITTWSSGDYIKARVLETSGVTMIGSGNTVTIGERFYHLNAFWSITHLASGECIIPYFNKSPFEKQCVRLSVSGVTITVKNRITLSNCSIGSWITRVDNTRAVVAHAYYPGNSNVVCQIISLDGVDNLIAGDQAVATTLNMTNAPFIDIAFLSPSSLVVGYVDINDPTPREGYVCPGTISGTTITFPSGDYGGSGYLVHDNCYAANKLDAAALHMTSMSGNHFVVSYISKAVGYVDHTFSKVGTVSGSNIILGNEYPWPTGDSFAGSWVAVDKLKDNNTFVFCNRRSSPIDILATVGIVNPENRTIDFGTPQACGFDKEIIRPSIVKLSNDKIFIIAIDCLTEHESHGVIANIDYGALMISPSDVYPTVSGNNRIAIGVWAKNPTLSSTEIIIKRSYEITLTSGSINFGSGTAIWNSSDIIDLINSWNDDINHFIVLDFYNTSGDNWQLRTSIDGSGFIDRGEQDSGSQTKDLIETAPSLYINNGNISNQWIDELIMWGGDFSITDQQLANLYELGFAHKVPMNNYTNYYQDTISGSLDVFHTGKQMMASFWVPETWDYRIR